MLVNHFPKLPTEIKLIESPYINFTNVIEDDAHDCDNIDHGIQLLRVEISDALLCLNPPLQSIRATPTRQPPHDHIDIDASSSMGLDLAPPVPKMKQSLGKLRLFTIGYSITNRAQSLPIRGSMTDIFDLSNKKMAEAFGNLLLSQIEE